MTDNELKELVAGLAVSQAKTDEQMAITDAQFKETNLKFAETEAQMKRTDEQIKRTDEKMERIFTEMGGISNNMGLSAEEYFYNSLADSLQLGGIHFDEIGKNVQKKSKRLEDEYDIVLYNGDCIALIECKYKAHENDLRKLMDKKANNFKELFPFYKDYKIYLGLSSFSFYSELEGLAKQNGVAILKQKGDIMVVEADNLKAF